MWVEEPGPRLLVRLPEIYAGSGAMAGLLGGLAVVAVLAALASGRGPLPGGLPAPGKVYLLVVWLFAFTALPLVISMYYVVVLGHGRHTIAASLAFYLLAAEGVRVLAGLPNVWVRRGPVLAVAATLILALSAPALHDLYTTVDKNQWRQATRYVDEHAARGDAVLYNNGLLFEHYSHREDLERYVIHEFPEDDLAGHERVWVMRVGGAEIPPELEEELDRSFRPTHEERYRGVNLTLFERRKPPG